MNRLILIGASGHGKVVADIAKLNGYNDIIFLDNDLKAKEFAGYPVLGPDTMTAELDGDIFIAAGKAGTRKRLMDKDAGRCFLNSKAPCFFDTEPFAFNENESRRAA